MTLTLGYCFINEQDLLSQLINVSGIIPRHLISDKTSREHRPSFVRWLKTPHATA
ncbi:hypothetical protein [Helicobacter pylori]|uniref:hypothetical protein n=1 Tax=Helicobacter pylori TaxID=210 RepID=UPI001BB3A477|nr:hypothetical protein [Helicobacter pylori]